MQLTPLQFKVIDRIANSSDGAILASIFEDIISDISNIRNLHANITTEEIRGRQIACTIIEDEIMARLKIKNKKTDESLESFE